MIAKPRRRGRRQPPHDVDAPSVQRLWSMARDIDTGGALRRFVPRSPRWCRQIGNKVVLASSQHRKLRPLEIQQLIAVFNDAHARQQAAVLRTAPTTTHAVLFERIIDRYGMASWQATLAVADMQDDLWSGGLA